MRKSELRAIELEYEVSAVRERPAVSEEPAEDPRDTLLRQILGALNRSRILPYPASAKAEKEYARYCKEYRARYGHLTIPSSLPLRLIRCPA